MEKGYVQIYTGDGKGKTTAALGLGLRAVGRGLKVLMVQFLKGNPSGELTAIEGLGANFEVRRLGRSKKFTWQLTEAEGEALGREIQEGFAGLWDLALDSGCDLLILDEAMAAISAGFISVSQMGDFIDRRPDHIELVLTGRNAPKELIDKADLVTEMKPVKHYFQQGVGARLGIEK